MASIPDTSLQRSLQARWEEVQTRFQEGKGLRRPELDRIRDSSFNTPEQVLEDLQRLERDGLDGSTTRHLIQVYPCLESMSDCYQLLLKTSPTLNINLSFFYRLVHMVIVNAMNSARIFAKLVEVLGIIRQDLVLIREYAPGITNSQELQTSIVESHVILLPFLVEAQKICRGYSKDASNQHPDTTTGDLEKLENQFNEASKKHNAVIENTDRHSKLGASRNQVFNVPSPLNTPESIEEKEDVFPCHGCLPAKLPRFFGREEEFKLMDACFKAPLPDQNRTFALYGLGGTGKTSTALQYAWIRRNVYDAIFWIKSESTADIQASFIWMATALGLASEDKKDSDNLSLRIRIWLQKTKKRWLIVYDNVEDAKVVEDNMPTGNGHVLLTTRYKWLAIRNGACPHELELLSPELSMTMFMGLCEMRDPKRDRESERAEIEKLLEEFGGLALPIDQITAYVSLNNLNIDTFRKKYARNSKRIHTQNDASRSEKSLATLWSVQFDRIRDKRAEEVLGLLALLPVDTPRDLLCPPEDDNGDDEISDIIDIPEDEMDEALDQLHKAALIKAEGDLVSVHRLVQKSFLETCIDPCPSRLQEIFNKACKALNYRFPKSDTEWSHFGRWEACARYLSHVLAVANLYDTRSRSAKMRLTMPEELVRLIRNTVWFQYEAGNHEDALTLLDIGYRGCPDESSLDYAHLCSHGACVLYECNSVAKGQERINKALEIREPRLDRWDGQLGNTFSNKGLLEASECRYAEALEFFDKSLAIRERLRNIYLAANHILRGMTLVLMGHLEQARIDLEHAGRLCRENGSKTEILNALRLFWLGNLSLRQGKPQEARELFQQAKYIKTKKAPAHRLTASFFYKVAVADLELGDVEQAIDNLKAAEEIAVQRNDLGEQARVLRMKAMALRQRPSATAKDIDAAQGYEKISRKTLEDFLQDKDPRFRSLSEDEQYGLLVCAERR